MLEEVLTAESLILNQLHYSASGSPKQNTPVIVLSS